MILVEILIPFIATALHLTVNLMNRFSPPWTSLDETQRHQGDPLLFHYLRSWQIETLSVFFVILLAPPLSVLIVGGNRKMEVRWSFWIQARRDIALLISRILFLISRMGSRNSRLLRIKILLWRSSVLEPLSCFTTARSFDLQMLSIVHLLHVDWFLLGSLLEEVIP